MGKHLVLVEGGHAHLTVLFNTSHFVQRGHRVTLIGPTPYYYYSGMGPGMLSGIYQPREVRFHGKKMMEDRGGIFVEDRVIRINSNRRTLNIRSGKQIDYEVASFNTGSEVPLKFLVSASRENIVPVKPVINYGQRAGDSVEEEFCVGRAKGFFAEGLHRSKVHGKISGVRGKG